MKNSKSIIAIIVLAILAFVSCKKDNENILNAKDNNVQQSFDYRQIEDKITYFKDFRKKMADSKTDEAFNLEDAAWHLACLANLDFCKVNVEYNEVQFDTIEMHVNITGGAMLLSNLNTAYEQMCTEIQQFKKGFNHSDQNLYFINVFINGNGNAKIALMTTYNSTLKGLEEHLWYFPDTFGYVDSVCDYYFSSSIQYSWDSIARDELQRILNLFEHYSNTPYTIFTPTQNYTFEYPNWSDSYGSSFILNSRLFARYGDNTLSYNLSKEEMCYCLDSYLGLGYDYISSKSLVPNEHPVNWIVTDTAVRFNNQKFMTHYHKLHVQYGQLFTYEPGPNPD